MIGEKVQPFRNRDTDLSALQGKIEDTLVKQLESFVG